MMAIAYQQLVHLGTVAVRLLPNLAIGVLVFLLCLLLSAWTRRLVQRSSAKKHHHQNLVLVFGRMTQWAVNLLGLLLALTITFPSFTPAKLISALGVTGIAIGFAFKDIFENFLAGILILLTEPFRIGDEVIFGGFEGTIEEILTRATKMRTYDGRLVVIPNSQLYKGSFIVNTAYPQRRLECEIMVGTGDDLAGTKRLVLETLGSIPGVERQPAPDVLVVDYAAAGVKLRVRWWITPPRRTDALDTQDRVLEQLKQVLSE